MTSTTLTNGQHGIILLEGEATIGGQIAAREKALKSCRAEAMQQFNQTCKIDSMLSNWIQDHIDTLAKLRSL